jgi:hypothetical protein
MASHRWDSCDANCACKRKTRVIEIKGSVLYKDDRKEAIRTGSLVIHQPVKLNFRIPDRRDNRDPQTVGEALLLERGAKGNGEHEISGDGTGMGSGLS